MSDTSIRHPFVYPGQGHMKPPNIHSLLGDPIMRKYLKTNPRLSPNLAHGKPWAVWGRKRNGKWAGGEFATYADAWRQVVSAVRKPGVWEDIAIVSKRQLFAPPAGYQVPWGHEWCSRCRRPTTYAIRPRHHAMRHAPVLTTEDNLRCYYCGARKVFASAAYSG